VREESTTAKDSRREHRRNGAEVEREHIAAQASHRRLLRSWRDHVVRLAPFRLRAELVDPLLHAEKAQCREYGQHERSAQKHIAPASERGAIPKRKIESDATVTPSRRKQRELSPLRSGARQRPDHPCILGRMAVELKRHPGEHCVPDEKGRHPEAERDAGPLDELQLVQGTFIKDHERQGDVDACRAV